MIVEADYIDHDYIVDYAGYYSRCFQSYPKVCNRVHFFNKLYDDEYIDNMFRGNDIEPFFNEDHYLGFLVIKPLPHRILGRICLKTYSSDNSRRYYPVCRPYNVHLYGLSTKLISLTFQEQDCVISVCATSALWSVFQKTSELFHHRLLSPFEITNNKAAIQGTDSRVLPNPGLNCNQIASVIRSVHLEPLAIQCVDENVFKNTFYAYIISGIPIIVVIELFSLHVERGWESMGLHAVTGTGFSLNDQDPFNKLFTIF
ncbi:hypothetical protein KJ762_09445 [bacterium]|nr:hypothetical protein [bacterium]MBU1063970.1 hypothetical protein [bacterium]MBU1634717.1 hypothetical protein [bacterium]MBU1874423.1 hypothetical protein [bacterium]